MNKILWDLFKETGDIKYYNLLQALEKRSDDDENRRSRRNSTK